MKKLRVFPTVKIKRIVPGIFPKHLGTVLLFLLFVPYLVTFFFGNLKEGRHELPLAELEEDQGEGGLYVSNATAVGVERIPFEHYVADKLARSIDDGYEMEALKAQAVLLRSGLLASAWEEDYGAAKREIEVEDEAYGEIGISERVYEAVALTAGVYLACENHPVNGSYFALSNGATRNGEELLLTEFPYLKSVPCSRDLFSPAYGQRVFYEEGAFKRLWEQTLEVQITEEEIMERQKAAVEESADHMRLYRDSAGYVLYLEWEGKFVSGEQFRESFHIPSSSFHLSEEEKGIEITSEGIGHGLGMSQYGANEMAKEGEDYVEILNYFFQNVTFRKIE